MNAWKTFAAVAVIFLAGLLAGGALVWRIANRSDAQQTGAPSGVTFQPWQLKDRYVGYLAKKLDLSLDQKGAISKIVTESQHRTKVLFEKVGPEVHEEMNRVRDAIRAVLSPEQQMEFDEIQRRHARHREDNDSKSKTGQQRPHKTDSEDDALNKDHPALKGKCENRWLLENLFSTPASESQCSG